MIHKFHLKDLYIVLDVCSGVVHVVDKLCYDLLDFCGEEMGAQCPSAAFATLNAPPQEIREAYEELFALYKNGQLFSKDDYEQFTGKFGPSPVKAMCLHIAHDCNLRCDYCFAAKGDFGHGRKLMPLEVGMAAMDYLVANSGARKNLEVDFFGGEPLMNFDVVKKIVAYARGLEKKHEKQFRFTVTTNGLLLDPEIRDYINREMDNVVLSIDGRKTVNDRLRVTPNGKGSYDAIVPKYKDLVSRRGEKSYYVRGTFTKHNLDFTQDVLHLYDLGFDQISVEPVVSDPKLDYSIGEGDLPAIFEEYERLADVLVEKKSSGENINFFHYMLDLDGGPCAIKRLRGCSAGNEYVAVTPEGDIYPCHQFVGIDGWKMGNILEGTLNMEMKKMFAATNVLSKEECRSCWARFFCSGGCNANNLQYAGDIQKPHKLSCELEKKRLECAIYVKAKLAEE